MFRHPSATDGYALTEDYVKSRTRALITYDAQRVLIISDAAFSSSGRWIDGLLLRGESGQIQDFVNITSGDITYTKAADEAGLEPLYFRFQLEDGRDYGIALLQSFGLSGMKSALHTDLQSYCANLLPDPLTVHLTQIVDKSVLEEFARSGQLQDVVLVNHGATVRSRTAMMKHSVGGQSLGDAGDKLELRLRKHAGWTKTALAHIFGVLRGKQSVSDVVKAKGMDDFDDLKVTVRLGNRDQTFSLLNPDDSPIRFEITDEVTPGDRGYPTLESLRRAAVRVYKEHLEPILS